MKSSPCRSIIWAIRRHSTISVPMPSTFISSFSLFAERVSRRLCRMFVRQCGMAMGICLEPPCYHASGGKDCQQAVADPKQHIARVRGMNAHVFDKRHRLHFVGHEYELSLV